MMNSEHAFLGLTNSTLSFPPPPPRYQVPVAFAAGAANGMAVQVVETNNVIKHPEEGCSLQVGEGMHYLLSLLPLIYSCTHLIDA